MPPGSRRFRKELRTRSRPAFFICLGSPRPSSGAALPAGSWEQPKGADLPPPPAPRARLLPRRARGRAGVAAGPSHTDTGASTHLSPDFFAPGTAPVVPRRDAGQGGGDDSSRAGSPWGITGRCWRARPAASPSQGRSRLHARRRPPPNSPPRGQSRWGPGAPRQGSGGERRERRGSKRNFPPSAAASQRSPVPPPNKRAGSGSVALGWRMRLPGVAP